MKKISCYFVILIFLSIAGIALADRGQVWPYPVELTEESQKAIILHNQEEEVLILGTTLKADREMGVLEFIPFPSEPTVSLAKGNPFATLQELIFQKKIHFEGMTKNGSYVFPVEISFEGQLGFHDVTVVKINDLAGFSKWVAEFFRKKGIPIKNNLSSAYQNAENYIQRGFNYFVFDYILLNNEVKSIEPLIYRFKSKRLYYPLKTSNVIGGEGKVDLVFVLPGSLGLLNDGSDHRKLRELFNGGSWDISSSSKVYPDEMKAIYPEAVEFLKTGKIYLQVLQFSGKYQFEDDLTLDISKIPPYAFKHVLYRHDYSNHFWVGSYELAEPLSEDELKDAAEAYNLKRPEWIFYPELIEAMKKAGYSLP